MKKLLSLAFCIACCSVTEASLLMQVTLPTARAIPFDRDQPSTGDDEVVPLAEQVFPETLNRHTIRRNSERDFQIEQLLEMQKQSKTAAERQRKLYEKIRQQKMLEKANR